MEILDLLDAIIGLGEGLDGLYLVGRGAFRLVLRAAGWLLG